MSQQSKRNKYRRRRKLAEKHKLEAAKPPVATPSAPPDNKGRKESRQPKTVGRLFPSNTVSIASKAVIVLSVLLGFYVAVLPKISASASDPLNPLDPFTSRFTISNDGYFEVNNSSFSCCIVSAKYEMVSFDSILINLDTEGPLSLEPGEKVTVPCPLTTGIGFPHSSLKRAVLRINVRFRPSWYPWYMYKRFVFVSNNTPSGESRWFPEPNH
jgi:hypothetical protein